MAPRKQRVVLLFCHGGSFNRQSWEPIVRRVKASPLLQRSPCEVFTFDWRYHGAKSSDADAATVTYIDGDQAHPRVDHPGCRWPEWAPQSLYEITRMLRNEDAANDRVTRIVGIGHSMGATSLLKTEMAHPGTFSGLVLFEPTVLVDKIPDGSKDVTSLTIARTLTRQEEWNSWVELVDHFKTNKAYRRWHPESLAAFLEGGIKQTGDGKFRLAMPLVQESALYSFKLVPNAIEDFARVRCRVVFAFGDETLLFNLPDTMAVVEAVPDRFAFAEPLVGKSHLTVVEDPETCAAHVIAFLQTLPEFHAADPPSKL